jgi:hypothetical protein
VDLAEPFAEELLAELLLGAVVFLVFVLPEGAVRFPPPEEARPVVFFWFCAIFLQAPF